MALSGALQTCDRFQLAPRATRRLNGHSTVAWNPLTATRKASTARRALTAVPRHVHADSRASAVGRRGARSYRTHKAAPARKSRRAAFRRVFADWPKRAACSYWEASCSESSQINLCKPGSTCDSKEEDLERPAENCIFNPTCFCLVDSLQALAGGGGGGAPGTCTPYY